MSIKADFQGLDDMLNKIAYLSNAEARSVFRNGVTAGARVVLKYAKAKAPGPGVSYKTKSSGDEAEAEIGPLKKNWYYRFAETGTQAHGPKRKKNVFMTWRENGKLIRAKRVRGVKARPWLQPALDEHVPEVQEAILSGYKKRLEQVSR